MTPQALSPIDYTNLEEALKRAYDQMDDLQRPAVSMARKSGRIILDMYMGTGKTFTCLTSLYCFRPQRILIICSKNALVTWRQETKKWFPEFHRPEWYLRVHGQAGARQKLWKTPAHYYITTSASFLRDAEFLVNNNIAFDAVIIDEAHRVGVKNHKSKGFKAITDIVFMAGYKKTQAAIAARHLITSPKFMALLSGTLASKGPSQLWGYLHLCNPTFFASYWRFVNTYCEFDEGMFGRVYVAPKNTEQLARVTAPYLYRIPEAEAHKSLPPIRRVPLWVELEPKQRQIYDQLEEHMWASIDDLDADESGELIVISTIIGKLIKLRQFLVCPAIVAPQLGAGAAVEAVWDKIQDTDKEVNPLWMHNFIVTPFVPAVQAFADYFVEQGIPRDKILLLKGGMEPDEVAHVEHRFRTEMDTMAISTIKFAQSFNLETGFSFYAIGFEWDPDENKQAESRIRRKTSVSRNIMAYYTMHEGLVDHFQMEHLDFKQNTMTLTYKHIEKYRLDYLARKRGESQ